MKQVRGLGRPSYKCCQVKSLFKKSISKMIGTKADKSKILHFFPNFQKKTDEKYKQMNVKVSQAGGTYSLWQVSCLNNWESHCHRPHPTAHRTEDSISSHLCSPAPGFSHPLLFIMFSSLTWAKYPTQGSTTISLCGCFNNLLSP